MSSLLDHCDDRTTVISESTIISAHPCIHAHLLAMLSCKISCALILDGINVCAGGFGDAVCERRALELEECAVFLISIQDVCRWATRRGIHRFIHACGWITNDDIAACMHTNAHTIACGDGPYGVNNNCHCGNPVV